jgi:hypothetical protein
MKRKTVGRMGCVAAVALVAALVMPTASATASSTPVRREARAFVAAKPIGVIDRLRRRLRKSFARNYAANYALNSWDPNSYLPSYSLAISWDGVNKERCFRWSGYRIDCVVSTYAQNYFTDVYGNVGGYAWCVGTIQVHKSRWTGQIWVVDENNESCGSTNDNSLT